MPPSPPHTHTSIYRPLQNYLPNTLPPREATRGKKDQEGGGDRPSIKDHTNWQTAGPCQQEEEKVKREAQGGVFQLLQITFLPDRIRLSFLSRSPSFYKLEHRTGKFSWECFTHIFPANFSSSLPSPLFPLVILSLCTKMIETMMGGFPGPPQATQAGVRDNVAARQGEERAGKQRMRWSETGIQRHIQPQKLWPTYNNHRKQLARFLVQTVNKY